MHGEPPVVVLRMGHRPGRDDRMTSHVALTARAFGADRVILEDVAAEARSTVDAVTEQFGGPFVAETTDSPTGVLQDFDGTIVHLTMYGERIQDVCEEIRVAHRVGPLLVVVGAEKVPFEVYKIADWNVGITNQPHSEIAALAVFLDALFEGRELDREFADADKRVIPTERGKQVDDGG